MGNCFWEAEFDCIEQCIEITDFYETGITVGPTVNKGWGNSLDMAGDTVIVGTYYDEGAAIYRRVGSGLLFITELPADQNESGGGPNCVKLSADGLYAVVGAYASSYVYGTFTAGLVFVYFNNNGTWELQQRLEKGVPIGGSNANYGWAVSINDDGTKLAVGAVGDTFGASPSVEVWSRSGAVWTRDQIIYSPTAPGNESFGDAVAIQGDWLLVGASYGANLVEDSGVVYAYKNTGSWVHTDTLMPSNDEQFILFGSAVDMDGEYAVIASMDYDAGLNDYSIDGYIFRRTGDSWAEVLRMQPGVLEADNSPHIDGMSVAISGNIAVLGDPASDLIGTNQGRAYVYENVGGTWELMQTMTASDEANNAEYGRGIGLDGNYMVIGAHNQATTDGHIYLTTRELDPGESLTLYTPVENSIFIPSACSPGAPNEASCWSLSVSGDYVITSNEQIDKAAIFFNNAGTWSEQAELTGSDIVGGELFGFCVKILGDWAFVGAPDWNALTTPGAVYVFKRTGAAWNETQKLVGSDCAAGWQFGYGIGVSGDTVVITAPGGEDGSAVDTGVAYVFTRSGETWTEQAKLEPSTGVTGGYFGPSAAIDGNTIAIGDYQDPASLYVYTRSGSVWTEADILTSNDHQAVEYFGEGVAVAGDYIVTAGGGWDDGGLTDAGRIQIFKKNGATWDFVTYLYHPTPAASNYMGYYIEADGQADRIVADATTNGVAGGNALFWQKIPGEDTWLLQAIFDGSDTAVNDRFGQGISIDGDIIAVGAQGAAGFQGQLYIFDLVPV